jgi:hypothetical protein
MESTSWGWILLGIAIGYIVSNYSRRSPEKGSLVERQKDPFAEGQFVPVTIVFNVSEPSTSSVPRPLPNNGNRIGIEPNSKYQLKLEKGGTITNVSTLYFSHKKDMNSNTVTSFDAENYFEFDNATSVLTTKNFVNTEEYVITIEGETIKREKIKSYIVAFRKNQPIDQ